MSYSVFISYRRDGGEGFAQMFNMMLSQKGYRVFYDIESLGVGLFNEKLLREIEAADVFLVLLTKGALDRCVNEGDWVRREIAHAISQNKPIVPVFFRGFEFPATLPSDLQKLPYYNGLDFSSMEYFDAKLDKLAHMLNEAASMLKDSSKPAPAPAQAAKPDKTPEEWYAMGMQYYDQQQYTKAVPCFTRAAEQGHVEAQCNLGYCYEVGNGVAQDYSQAVYWFKKAAEQGFSTAQFNLGVCYINGQGVAKDDSQAVYWFKKAAEQGHATAKQQLAKLTNT